MMPDQNLPQSTEGRPAGTQAASDSAPGRAPRFEPSAGLRRAATRFLGRMRKPGTGPDTRPAAGKGAGR